MSHANDLVGLNTKIEFGNAGAGSLEMFGPNGTPWRTANDAYLHDAIELAKTDVTAALKLAAELVAKSEVAGVVRFRCAVPAQIVH
ncbi:MAG: hypothetical protein PHF20_01375 [Halothiobacillaceae bacterium]|nr:hypothetical protein [Halothiobacillaceae bacterium]